MGGVADKADELVEVGRSAKMMVEGPAGGFCVLLSG
jgi:hypothetical protein